MSQLRKTGPLLHALAQPKRQFMSCAMSLKARLAGCSAYFCLADTAVDLFLRDFLSARAAFGDCFPSLPLLSHPPLPVPTSAFIFLRVWQTAKKFQTAVVLSQQPLLQLSLGRGRRVSHLMVNVLPGSWAWGRSSGGNSGNLIGWAVQRTVKPLYKDGGQNSTRVASGTQQGLIVRQRHPTRRMWHKCREKKKKKKKFQEASGAPFMADLIEQMETTNVRNTVWCPLSLGFPWRIKNPNIAKTCVIY